MIQHTQTNHPILTFLSFRQANVSFGTLTTTAAWQLVGTKLDVHLSKPKAWTVAWPMTSSSSAEPAPTEVVPEAMPDASTVGCIRMRIMKT